MKLVIVASLVFAICLSSSCIDAKPGAPSSSGTPVAQVTATPDEFATARVDFAKHCVECHGAQGEGGLKTVDNKKLKVPSLREGHALKHTDEDFVEQIVKGGDGMPEFKSKLPPAEISLLVRYVRHEFQGK